MLKFLFFLILFFIVLRWVFRLGLGYLLGTLARQQQFRNPNSPKEGTKVHTDKEQKSSMTDNVGEYIEYEEVG